MLLDSSTGTLKASQDACGAAADVFFDSRRQRIYVSCASGVADVFGGSGGIYRHLTRMDTQPRCQDVAACARA